MRSALLSPCLSKRSRNLNLSLTPRRLPTQTSHRRRMRPNRPIKRRLPRRRSLKIRKRRQPDGSTGNTVTVTGTFVLRRVSELGALTTN